MIRSLWVPGPPKPAERPRIGKRNRAFTPKPTRDAEALIAEAWETEFGSGVSFDGNVFLEVDYSPKGQYIRLVSTPQASPLRGDIDNYLKTTMDGLQKAGAFANDRAVMHVMATKYDADYDRVRGALMQQ